MLALWIYIGEYIIDFTDRVARFVVLRLPVFTFLIFLASLKAISDKCFAVAPGPASMGIDSLGIGWCIASVSVSTGLGIGFVVSVIYWLYLHSGRF